MLSTSVPTSKKTAVVRNGNRDDFITPCDAIKGSDFSNSDIASQEGERTSEMVAVLNMLDIVHTLSIHFVCKLCHCFMIDICTFPCGHMFCKYCGLSSLRRQSKCPLCHEETYKPFATRCYEIDSVIDDFYPLLWNFYRELEKSSRDDGRVFIKVVTLKEENLHQQLQLESASLSSSLSSSSKNLNKKAIQIHSPSDREKLRKQRRLVTERKDILLQAPCTSILQKLATLGWGTSTDEQSIHFGMQTVVWLALCYALWNFIYVFQHPWFDHGLRTFVYAIAFLVAFNILQMHFFVNPEVAPNLFDFELFEWSVQDQSGGGGANTSNEVAHVPQVEGNVGSQRNVSSGGSGSGNSSNGVGGRSARSNKSSDESFKDCSEDEEGNRYQHSLRELELMLYWRKEGSLDFEKMFKIADEMMDALNQMDCLETSALGIEVVNRDINNNE